MVEWKPLKNVCNILNGFAFKSQEYVPEGIRIIRISDVQNGYISNKDKVFYPIEKLNECKKYMLNSGDLVMSLTGNPGRVALIKENCALNQRVACLRAKGDISNSFLFYLFYSKKFESIAFANSTGGAQKNLSTTWLNNYKIPVPSPSEQTRIVDILDTFTASIENLNQQIAERRKQLEHYLDQVYNLKSKYSIVSLSEIGKFTRGKRFVREDVVEEGYPCIHYGDMYTYYGTKAYKTKTYIKPEKAEKLRFAHKGDVVIVGAGENKDDIGIGLAWLGEDSPAIHDACYIFEHDNSIDPMYISYFLRSHVYNLQIRKNVSEAKICAISSAGIGKAKLPLPSLSEQQSVVSKLDTFSNLISKLEEERDLHQKQYEYYREKLLTFE